MRNLIVSNIISVDGYLAGPGGNPLALPMDAAFNAHNRERLQAASTLLLGARSYAGFSQYWPGVADDPSADEDNRAISRLNGAIEKLVVTDSLQPTGPWAASTEVVARADAHARVRALKQEAGDEILVFGSGVLVNDLLAAGLVDELHLMIGPVVLGEGVPAFARPYPLRTLGVRTFPGSGNIVVRYAAGPGAVGAFRPREGDLE